MGDFSHRAATALLSSELLPVTIRMKLMRALGFEFADDACIWAGASLRSKKITIEPGVFINVGFFHDGFDYLHIRRNVRIGQFVRVLTATHDVGPSHQRGLIEVVGQPVEIQEGCWIGANSTILPGVVVAPGCVIGAGSIVLRSTEPNGVYAGNPARLVRLLEE